MADKDLQELDLLLERLCDDALDEDAARRLVELLDAGEVYRRRYLDTIELHAGLWRAGGAEPKTTPLPDVQTGGENDLGFGDFGIRDSELGIGDFHVPNPKSQIPNQQIPSLSPLPPSLSTTRYPLSTNFVGGPVFSYIAAAVILGVMVLCAWAYKITRDYGVPFASDSRGSTAPGLSTPQRPAPVFVGRITGMRDCRWTDPQTEAYPGASVPLGRAYALSAGLMEITYDSGAKVVLEGPCRYEIESDAGGFLALGKLTAKVESGEWRVESVRRSEAGGLAASAASVKPLAAQPQAPSPKAEISKSPNLQISKFSVRTPTAVVTDLGTEFGVEVDAAGDTASYVFQGRVSVRAAGPAVSAVGEAGQTVLSTGESARVKKDRQTGDVRIAAGGAAGAAPKFVRRLPHRGPVRVYGTGQNVRRGAPDPHWHIAACRNDPDFKPQPAITTATHSKYFRAPRPERAVWVSTGDWLPLLPEGTVYTFRTTFHLNGEPPTGLELRGGCAADNHVEAIRLNGRPAAVPEHGYQPPFYDLHPFVIAEGFVEGLNVLEFDVSNGVPKTSQRPSRMVLLVELEAVVAPDGAAPDVSPENDPNDSKQPSDGGKGDG